MSSRPNDSEVFYFFGIVLLLAILASLSQSHHGFNFNFHKWWFLIPIVTSLFISAVLNTALNRGLKKYDQLKFDATLTNGKSGEESVFAGVDSKGKKVYIPLACRRMHAQVIGTTNAGKTESVIIPWAVDDISKGRGLLLLDGKSDRDLLNKLYAYVNSRNRNKSFKYFSLANLEESHTFNPLIEGTPEEIRDRIFNVFEFDNEYYRGVQYEIFGQIFRIFILAKETPTFTKLYNAISDPTILVPLLQKFKDDDLILWAQRYILADQKDREQRTAGLLSQMSQFVFGNTAQLFNDENPSITINDVLKNNEIVYFQLPVLRMPVLGKAVGKLVLQSLQAAVSERHNNGDKEHKFFACYLDDFSEFLPPTFISLLNKSRSANVGITFAHQALGDLKALGDEVANTILVNSNLKVFMRTNEPDSAEYFAKVIGTKLGEKFTERQNRGFIAKTKTGEGSVRDVEEFIFHPNIFKSELGIGQAVICLPHAKGTKTIRLKFSLLPNLPPIKLPPFHRKEASLITKEVA